MKCWDNDDLLRSSILKLKDSLGNANVTELLERTDVKDYYYIAKFLMENYYDRLYLHSQDKYEYEFTVNSDKFMDACDKVEDWYRELLKKEELD